MDIMKRANDSRGKEGGGRYMKRYGMSQDGGSAKGGQVK